MSLYTHESQQSFLTKSRRLCPKLPPGLCPVTPLDECRPPDPLLLLPRKNFQLRHWYKASYSQWNANVRSGARSTDTQKALRSVLSGFIGC